MKNTIFMRNSELEFVRRTMRTEIQYYQDWVNMFWDCKPVLIHFVTGLYVNKSAVEFLDIMKTLDATARSQWASAKIKQAYAEVTGNKLKGVFDGKESYR